MPYEWHHEDSGPSRLTLWPHRPLQARGFVSFVGITAALMALPLLATMGTPVLWVLLAFIAATLAGVWFALRRNIRDRQLVEELILTTDLAHLSHRRADGETLHWQANPFWITVTLRPTGGPVPHYLTLKGKAPREVELGAFLTEAERQRLAPELRQALNSMR